MTKHEICFIVSFHTNIGHGILDNSIYRERKKER
jgi:hypothetical protein